MTRRAWALFVAMSLIWGVPYLLIKIAVAEVSPVGVVLARIAIAAIVLLPIALARGAFRGLRPRLGGLLGLALLEIAVPMPLISAGEQRIPSSLTGLLISIEPLFIALLALRFDASERVTGTRLAGLVLGVAGVTALLGFDVRGGPEELLGAGMTLLATLCYAGGALLMKRRLGGVDSLGVSTATLLIGTAVLTPLAWASMPARPPSGRVLLALLLLGLLCTALAFLLFFALISAAGAGRASVITYVNPAVAVLLGVLVLGEPVTAATVAGFLLIIAGSWLSTGGAPPPGLPATRLWLARPKPADPPPPGQGIQYEP